MTRVAVFSCSLALMACSGTKSEKGDTGLDPDAPSDMTELTDPDVAPDVLFDPDLPTDTSLDPDVTEADVDSEDMPGDPETEDVTCDGPPHPVLSDVRITNDPARSNNPSLAWTGSEFGVTWADSRDVGYENIYFARISSSGSKVGTDVRLSEYPGGDWPRIVWTGSEFGVSWSGVYFVRVSASGSMVGTVMRVADVGSPVDIDWTGSEFGIVWRGEGSNVYFASLSPTGAEIVPDVQITYSGGAWVGSIVWSGSEHGLVWMDDPDGNEEIYFARISSSGSKIGTDLRITNAPYWSRSPYIAWTGSEYGVTWTDSRAGIGVYFVRISSSGSKIGTDLAITTPPPMGSLASKIAWTGSEFGVSWYDDRDSAGYDEIYFARISSSGSKIGTDVRITNAAFDSQFPDIVWTGSEYGVVWQDGRDATYGAPNEIYFNRIGFCP